MLFALTRFTDLAPTRSTPTAVAKIRELKGREENKPILLLLADASVADRFIADRSKAFEDVARKFWPGPLTIVGAAVANLPPEITAGTGTVGVRVPADERFVSLFVFVEVR